jgi:hypothetical protein
VNGRLDRARARYGPAVMQRRLLTGFRSLSPTVRFLWFIVGFQLLGMVLRALS